MRPRSRQGCGRGAITAAATAAAAAAAAVAAAVAAAAVAASAVKKKCTRRTRARVKATPVARRGGAAAQRRTRRLLGVWPPKGRRPLCMRKGSDLSTRGGSADGVRSAGTAVGPTRPARPPARPPAGPPQSCATHQHHQPHWARGYTPASPGIAKATAGAAAENGNGSGSGSGKQTGEGGVCGQRSTPPTQPLPPHGRAADGRRGRGGVGCRAGMQAPAALPVAVLVGGAALKHGRRGVATKNASPRQPIWPSGLFCYRVRGSASADVFWMLPQAGVRGATLSQCTILIFE